MPAKSNPQKIKIALIQSNCSDDPEDNLKQALSSIRRAAQQEAQVICLQELFRSLYFCQEEDSKYFELAESIPGPTTQTLSDLAKELEVVLIAPLFEKRSEGLYHNSAVVIDADGSLLGSYRKMHIPEDPGFYEKFYFAPGDAGFQSYSTRYGCIGVLICWDQWFPEAARLTTLSGAHILFYPTAIGFQEEDAGVAAKQASAWETIQRGHAIANGVFVAAINRVGRENKIQFWGQSFVCDPFGELLAKASAESPEILTAECDLSQIEETRQGWPFLRDRRIDSYQSLSRLYVDPDD